MSQPLVELAVPPAAAALPAAPPPDLLPKPGFGAGGLLAATLPEALAGRRPRHLRRLDPDEAWMAEALCAAMQGIGLANPNPCVGCVIVKDGRELARGATEVYGGRHAERVAIARARAAGHTPTGATVYVTLEPCAHQGRQPPCVEALLACRPARVVVGLVDPDRRVDGGGLAALRAAGIALRVGVLRRELLHWHMPFLLATRLRRPILVGKWAQTLDGQLYDAPTEGAAAFRWISGSAARAYTHWLRQKYDAILVGAGTVLADRPSLTVRDCAGPINRHPLRLLHDPNGRLLTAPAACLEGLVSAAAPSVLLVDSAAAGLRGGPITTPAGRLDVLPYPAAGDPLAWLRDAPTQTRLAQILGRPLQSVLVEGGPRLLAALLRRELLDWVHVFLAPALGAGTGGRIPARLVPGQAQLRPVAASLFDCDLLVDYAGAAAFAALAEVLQRGAPAAWEGGGA